MKRQLLLFLIILSFTVALHAASALAQDFPDVCQDSENILPNCNFDNGLAGWIPYLEDGSANISVLQGGGECHAPLCPAAHIVTEGHFIGGIYQQVSVGTGNTYYANIVWLAFDSLVNDPGINAATGGVGRRIGIDPFGGTDSRSSNVVWSEDNWRNDCKICNVEQVTVSAQADTITVFIRIDDTWRLRAAAQGFDVPPSKDQFWLDDIGMKRVAGNAVPFVEPTEPPPTDTPVPPPPTDTPPPPPPTETPEPDEAEPPTDTPTPAEVAQAESPEAEIVSPLATPTPAKMIAPPPTLTPSPTRSPTPTPPNRPSPTPTGPAPAETAPTEEPGPPILSAGLLGMVGTTACVGGLILLIMGAVMAGLVWLYRLGWGDTDADEYEDDFAEDDIVINLDE